MAAHDTIKAERRRADMRPAVLALHAALGGNLTARHLATAMRLSLNTAKRVLQAFREAGDLPAYAPPAAKPLTAAQRAAILAAKRQYNRRMRATAVARRVESPVRDWEPTAAEIRAAVETIRSGWSAAQWQSRAAYAPCEWEVPGVRDDRRRRWDVVDHAS